ncbi:hypothetical protein Ato02nite_062970 [Paractinoplanes toevensis]|uniref:Uncharacterized protein n=1 Tax=Paractinoplanes toevensis TaxID=571911 RepID=A0A919W4T2_9ACTN|nr:hypothetical protein Ato02nite_062970 [Actinoplanes toevensis]
MVTAEGPMRLPPSQDPILYAVSTQPRTTGEAVAGSNPPCSLDQAAQYSAQVTAGQAAAATEEGVSSCHTSRVAVERLSVMK